MFNLFNRPPVSTPGGTIPAIYADMAKQVHLLIAGKTGAGKSIVINGIIYSQLCQYFPNECQYIFVDPKRVELVQYKNLPHCLAYASEPGQPITALKAALAVTESRYKIMQSDGLKKFPGGHVYIVIDELADIMTTCKAAFVPLLQRLAQIGRAANVHIIAATQCPLTKIIPTEIKVNFDSVLGLKTVTAQHSRNIIGRTGCELLPKYGQGYYQTPDGLQRVKLPMIPESELDRVVKHWER